MSLLKMCSIKNFITSRKTATKMVNTARTLEQEEQPQQ
jgi:hypothetical protein